MHSIPTDLPWRTSSYTTSNNCVEVADQPGTSAVRDTKHRNRDALTFPTAEWRAFVEAVKDEEI